MWGNRVFAGTVPRKTPRQLSEQNAQVALDCWLDRRRPRPIPEPVHVAGVPAFSPIVKTIYRFDETRWFAWNDEVDVVPAPMREDTTRRTIWTGDDYPRHTSTVIMRAGGFVSPGLPISRRLGVPAPEGAPGVALGALTNPTGQATGTIGSARFQAEKAGAAANGITVTVVVGTERAAAWDAGTRTWTLTITAGDTVNDLYVLTSSQIAFSDPNGIQVAAENLSDAATAGSVRLADGGNAAGQNGESHAWVYTFLTDIDEEGPPSSPSVVVTRRFNADGSIQPATITMRTAVQGSYGINRKRLYRTATGAGGVTTYRLVATLPLSQSSFEDTVLTAGLGGALVSANWDPPPADLKGIIALPNGVLAGFRGRDVYLSEPFQPHAWPPDYIQTVEAEIVGLDAFGTNIVVGTKGQPHLIFGSHPAGMAAAKQEFNQACVAKRSFAYLDKQGVAYASPDGLVLVGPDGGQFVTKELFDRADWQALGPADFQAVYHDGTYLAFTPTRAIAFDPDMSGVIEVSDAGVKAIFPDRERDTVYVVGADNRLAEWKTDGGPGDTLRTMRWRSKLHVGRARNFSAAQVIAEDYPVRFRLFGDGQTVHDADIQDSQPFRLNGDHRYANWEYEVEGRVAVDEVRIGSMMEMLGG